MTKLISVVLPCRNEAKNLPLLIPEIISNIPKKYNYEIVCVNDASDDDTLTVIKKLASKIKNIKGISFHKRFFHQAALVAGIKVAKGDAVITMDADFQHPPKLITQFIKFWEQGYDLIQGQKKSDESSNGALNIQRSLGYLIWTKISDGIIIPGVSDFRLMSKSVVAYVKKSKESEIFLRGIVNLGANKPLIIPYEVAARKSGKSNYNKKMFFNMFINGFISFSVKPLRFAWIIGLIVSVLSTAYIISDMILATIAGRSIIEGWKTIVALLLVLNGFIIFYLGILGEYLGVVFKEVKRRPRYIIDEKINF